MARGARARRNPPVDAAAAAAALCIWYLCACARRSVCVCSAVHTPPRKSRERVPFDSFVRVVRRRRRKLIGKLIGGSVDPWVIMRFLGKSGVW